MTSDKYRVCFVVQCSSRLVLIVSSLFLSLDLPKTFALQCTPDPSSNCRCRFDDADQTVIDFSPISLNNGKPKFDFAAYGAIGDFVYAFNPCHGFKAGGDCDGVSACQRYKDGSLFPIGDVKPVSWVSISETAILGIYSSTYQGLTRQTEVAYTCDKTALQPTLTFVNELPTQTYNFVLSTCLACIQDVPGCPRATNGGGGISVGGILCIVFTVLVLVYFIGGILFMKYAKGAEGKELIPNYAFWIDLPALVKDGFMLVISPCRRGGGGYEEHK